MALAHHTHGAAIDGYGGGAPGVQQGVAARLQHRAHAQALQGGHQHPLGVVEVQVSGALGPKRFPPGPSHGTEHHLPLVRELGRLGQIHTARLEEAQAARRLPEARGQSAQHAAPKGGAQVLLLSAHGVGQTQRLRPVGGAGLGLLQEGLAHQAVGDDLLHPSGHQQVPQVLAEVPQRLPLMVRHLARQRLRGDGVVADGTGDLLDHILLDGHITPPVRGRDHEDLSRFPGGAGLRLAGEPQ